MKPDYYDFGEILREQRKLKGWTQSQLATKLKLDTSTINKYESNTVSPKFETVRDLSNIFNVSTDVFYGSEPRETVSTFNLSESQVKILNNLATSFRNKEIKKNLSSEQYELIGQIVVELTK